MRQRFALFALILITAGLGFLAFWISQQLNDEDLSSEDSSALVGGNVEAGYPSAGFILARLSSTSFGACGASYLGQGTVVTAAHCIEQQSDTIFGIGPSFDNPTETFEILEYEPIVFPFNDNVEEDFAVLRFDDSNLDLTEARISTPTISCGYEVVGYGQEDNSDVEDLSNGRKKSITVCIDSIATATFEIQGQNGGICFGDSGSPIYRTDTEEVVGIISSITFPEGAEPCFIGNTGVAVRTDFFEDIVFDNQENLENDDSENENVNSPLVVNPPNEVTNDLAQEDNLDVNNQDDTSANQSSNLNQQASALPNSSLNPDIRDNLLLGVGMSFSVLGFMLLIGTRERKET